MGGSDEVLAFLTRAQELPYASVRTGVVEDALRLAEAAGDDVLAFHVRVRLTDAYRYGGEPAKALVMYERTLAEHDREPGRYEQTFMLLWQMKAQVSSLVQFPDVSLERVYALLDEMERRYLKRGHSLQAVYRARHEVASHIGDPAADEWYVKWREARRDSLSACEDCDAAAMVRYLAQAGRHAEAFELGAPVLESEPSCEAQPHALLTALLPVFLHTGRFEDAAYAHRRAYRVYRDRTARLGDVAAHLEFCALTGNEARGLEIAERHLGILDPAASPYVEMRFAAAAALVLGERRTELRADLAERATRLAGRFDARNGTSHQGGRVRAVLAAEPVVDLLPLFPGDRPVGPDLAGAYLADGRPLDAAEVAEEVLDVAEDRVARRRAWTLLAHAQKELGEDAAATFADLAEDAAQDGDHGMAARCLEDAGEFLAERDRDVHAAEEFARAAEAYGRAADPGGVVRARRRAAMCLFWSDRAERAVAVIEEARAALEAMDDGPGRVRETAFVSRDRARLLADAGRLPEAVSLASAAVDGFQSLGEARLAEEAARLRDVIAAARE